MNLNKALLAKQNIVIHDKLDKMLNGRRIVTPLDKKKVTFNENVKTENASPSALPSIQSTNQQIIVKKEETIYDDSDLKNDLKNIHDAIDSLNSKLDTLESRIKLIEDKSKVELKKLRFEIDINDSTTPATFAVTIPIKSGFKFIVNSTEYTIESTMETIGDKSSAMIEDNKFDNCFELVRILNGKYVYSTTLYDFAQTGLVKYYLECLV